MNSKYSNIFWHQGVKIFEEELLHNRQGRIRISHLENDVTKAFINVLEHTSRSVLGRFLKMIGVHESPDVFSFDFQITDRESFKQKKQRVMVSLISSSTRIIEKEPGDTVKSIPDAAIHSDTTAILIESKTQSPLFTDQIVRHIKMYLGQATYEKIISWEEVGELFRELAKSGTATDKLLLTQFVSFLELLGIAEFNGFKEDDFIMLDAIGRMTGEDFLDYKRIIHRKVEKLMSQLSEIITITVPNHKIGWKVCKPSAKTSDLWSAFYFYRNDPDIHVNHFPNINLHFHPLGIELSLNAETKQSLKFMLKMMQNHPDIFTKPGIPHRDFSISLYYKIQYRPMDNFIWDLIPGYPKPVNSINADALMSTIQDFSNGWEDIVGSTVYKMKSGRIRQWGKLFYSEKEIDFALNKNPNPNFVIRINKEYSRTLIESKKRSIVKYLSSEIEKLNELIKVIFE